MPRLVLPVTEPGSLAAEVQPDIPMDDDLRLRPFELADVPAVLEAFSDPDIQRWHFRRFDSTDEAEAWVRSANDGWRSESAATWAIQSATETVVGRITLYPKLEAGHGEISYWVLPRARGKSVATRALRTLVRWAHAEAGLQRVEVQHSVLNRESCGVAKNAGFQTEGTKRSALLHADGWHDMHLHSHLATDESL